MTRTPPFPRLRLRPHCAAIKHSIRADVGCMPVLLARPAKDGQRASARVGSKRVDDVAELDRTEEGGPDC